MHVKLDVCGKNPDIWILMNSSACVKYTSRAFSTGALPSKQFLSNICKTIKILLAKSIKASVYEHKVILEIQTTYYKV